MIPLAKCVAEVRNHLKRGVGRMQVVELRVVRDKRSLESTALQDINDYCGTVVREILLTPSSTALRCTLSGVNLMQNTIISQRIYLL